MNLIPIFNAIGFSPEAARIYSTLLNKGPLKVAILAKHSGIPRTTCYEYIPKLAEKGLIEVELKEKSKLYKTTHPQNLLNLVFKQKNDVNFQLSNLENSFDELNTVYEQSNQGVIKPTFEAKELSNDAVEALLKSLLKIKDISLVMLLDKSFVVNPKLKKHIRTLIEKYTAIIPISYKNDFKGKFVKYLNYSSKSNIIKIIVEDGIIWMNLDKNIVTLLRDQSIVTVEKSNFDMLYENN